MIERTTTFRATTTALPRLGAPFGGGFYGGQVHVGDHVFAVVWAPRPGGQARLPWMAHLGLVRGCSSLKDSAVNTRALAAAGSPPALWATALRLGGHDDWLVPARDVLELGYRHFKPSATENNADGVDGQNASSLPRGQPYSRHVPAATPLPHFGPDGSEAFIPEWHWSSTQYNAAYAKGQCFAHGEQLDCGKRFPGLVRAVRLVPLTA